MQRGPSAPTDALPAIRGASPNVAKRAWSTPRHHLGTSAALDADGPPHGALAPPQQTSTSAEVSPLEDALEVLHAVLLETTDQSEGERKRRAALEEVERLRSAEEHELERTRLAADEQLQTTLQLLQAELARERRRRSTGEAAQAAVTAAAPATARKGSSERQTVRLALAPRLRDSPLKPRAKEPATPAQLEDREAVEGSCLALFDSEATVDSMHTSAREAKLHQLRDERARWQRDYELMREQVIEEKARQVALFQRLELVRRSHARQLSEAEGALRASQAGVERLQARLAQGRVSAAQEARRAAALVQSSRSERQRLVCALAETRLKFREWKEGEAATLRATREQAVHALRTEYELKLARHQEEKQKLRDKVKDLEVSLRLLQRDRQLSPGELSERKGTLLQHSSSSSAIGYGDVGAADFIEAQGRIHELEALLQLSRERQAHQDALLRVSETALARLSQERELDALESLSLPSPAVALAMTGDVQPEKGEKANAQDPPTPAPIEPVAAQVASARVLRMGERKSSAASVFAPPSTPTRSPTRRQSVGAVGADVEKELLRRKSIALSAEVNRCQKIVVQSMEEVRALKESRRRSRSGSISSAAVVLNPREAYLLEELATSRREVEALERRLKKSKKDKPKRSLVSDDVSAARSEASDADSSTSGSDSQNGSDDSSDSDSDDGKDEERGAVSESAIPTLAAPAPVSPGQPRLSFVKEHGQDEEESDEKEAGETDDAVKAIQTCSKGFLARRDFIRKKLAISKIKARYRGYLVRKNYEALGGNVGKLLPSGLAPQESPDFLLVTEALQYKMQVVEPHMTVSYSCGKTNGDNVDVVLRVSKDPPVLQLQVTPRTGPDQEALAPRVTYFHLFETIALLPYEDEEIVLETSGEKEIARIFASRLIVQRKDSDNDYHFFIVRPAKEQHDGTASGKEDPALSRGPRTLLTELPVQPMETRATSASSDTLDASLGGMPPALGQEVDLDSLIRQARTEDPLDSDAKAHPEHRSEAKAEDPTARIRRLVKRLSSSSFDLDGQRACTPEANYP